MIKFICVGGDINLGWSNEFWTNGLTMGKIYYGEKDHDKDGTILNNFVFINENDNGVKRSYPSFLFKTLDEIRDDKLNNLLL